MVLNSVIDELFEEARREGRTVAREQLAFDALTRITDDYWDILHGIDPWEASDDGEASIETNGTDAEAEDEDAHNCDEVDDVHDGDDQDHGETAIAANVDTEDDQGNGETDDGDEIDVDHDDAVSANADKADVPQDGGERADSDEGGLGGDLGGGRPDAPDQAEKSSGRVIKVVGHDGDRVIRAERRGQDKRHRRRRKAKRGRTNPKALALLRVDLEALVRGAREGDELCEVAGVGQVSVEAARAMLGESILGVVITAGRDVLNVTHLGRRPSWAQELALLWSQPICSVQGCNCRRVEWDHRTPWANQAETRVDNLDGLCRFHHQLKSLHGWALLSGTGRRPMVPPDDPRHPKHHTRSRQAA